MGAKSEIGEESENRRGGRRDDGVKGKKWQLDLVNNILGQYNASLGLQGLDLDVVRRYPR